MSQESRARAAVQALIPDDEILDVALTYPRGYTKSQAVGAAAGGVIGFGGDFQAKRLGTLDVKALIELLMLSNEHLDDSVEEEDARTE